MLCQNGHIYRENGFVHFFLFLNTFFKMYLTGLFGGRGNEGVLRSENSLNATDLVSFTHSHFSVAASSAP